MLILAMGWGFRAQAQACSFSSCWEQALDSLQSPAALHAWHGFALTHKLGSPADRALQTWQALNPTLTNCTWHRLSPEALKHITTPTQSPVTQQRFGTGSVCEAMALLGLAMLCSSSPVACNEPLPASWLKQKRVISHDRLATLAIAACSTSIQTTS